MPAACQKVPLQRILGQATFSHDEVTTSFAWSRSVAHSLRRFAAEPCWTFEQGSLCLARSRSRDDLKAASRSEPTSV